MNLLSKLKLKNFKCFRNEEVFDFEDSTYLIGVNNAGKTSVLHGIKCFFDNTQITGISLLNKAEFTRKQSGYRTAIVSMVFNLEALTTKTRKDDLIKRYGKELSISKEITYTPESDKTTVLWKIGDDQNKSLDLPEEIEWLFNAIKLTYIHPQEGKQLLTNVQKRLRQRLLSNWGRGATLTHNIKTLEDQWGIMRAAANKYLSQSLTDSVQSFWPDSKVTIDLPKKIREIIDIADISFQGDKLLPEIELTAQGTGAQSTILYLAHFLLDSDRSLNRGEYHPVWLMEEPESFLHADLLAKFSKHLNSARWLQDIQMITSSHSPILLASSRAIAEKTRWIVMENYKVTKSVNVKDVTEELVNQLGILMGDNNFQAYFTVAEDSALVFLENKKEITAEVLRKCGIPISKGLEGIGEVGKCLDVLKTIPEFLRATAYFIVDNDKGVSQLSRHINESDKVQELKGFTKYKCNSITGAYIVCLPKNTAIEDLFLEYHNHLLNCKSKIWDKNFKIYTNTPSILARVVGKAKAHNVVNEEQQLCLIKNEQEIKDLFWSDVKRYNYVISPENQEVLLELIKV